MDFDTVGPCPSDRRFLHQRHRGGHADLTGPYTIQLYATTDRTLNGAILVGSLNVASPLTAGASSPFVVRSVIPKGAPAGTYHLLAAVRDAAGHVTPIAAEDTTLRICGAAAKSIPGAAPGAARQGRWAGAFSRIDIAKRRLG